jgi:hypothetical protein
MMVPLKMFYFDAFQHGQKSMIQSISEVDKYKLTFSRVTACHVLCNLYTGFDCRPEMIALRDEKFFNTRNS